MQIGTATRLKPLTFAGSNPALGTMDGRRRWRVSREAVTLLLKNRREFESLTVHQILEWYTVKETARTVNPVASASLGSLPRHSTGVVDRYGGGAACKVVIYDHLGSIPSSSTK